MRGGKRWFSVSHPIKSGEVKSLKDRQGDMNKEKDWMIHNIVIAGGGQNQETHASNIKQTKSDPMY